jgi:indolepyruvate ferredoxin oxidoreductase
LPPGFIRDPDFALPARALTAALKTASRPDGVAVLDATRLAADLLGDSIGANVLMLGFAFQRGLLPVSGASLYRALELYGRNVEENKLAFDWGRYAAESPEEVEQLAGAREGGVPPSKSLEEIVARRAEFLTAYQDRDYARRYEQAIEQVAAAEERVRPGSTELTEAAARAFFALLAYKDEYEVARLYTETSFEADLRRSFGADIGITYHFSPPLFARVDRATGRPKKYAFGPWARPFLKLLAKARRVRGTVLDPFRYSADRRLEVQLLEDYERLLGEMAAGLDDSRFDIAVELARLPLDIRGFGPIKRKSAERAAARRTRLLEEWKSPAARRAEIVRARATAA